jgi:hypothetical protein
MILTCSNLQFLMEALMEENPQPPPAGATAASKQLRMPAPMDAVLQDIHPHEHVAERFEDFARKLVEAAKPPEAKKRTRTRARKS